MKLYIECNNHDQKSAMFRLLAMVVPEMNIDFKYLDKRDEIDYANQIDVVEIDVSKAGYAEMNGVANALAFFQEHVEREV